MAPGGAVPTLVAALGKPGTAVVIAGALGSSAGGAEVMAGGALVMAGGGEVIAGGVETPGKFKPGGVAVGGAATGLVPRTAGLVTPMRA